jgi:peptidoglycan/xylan/chitin deacetylase (PgdA/CDA1 family)
MITETNLTTTTPVTNFREFESHIGFGKKLRTRVRDLTILSLSIGRSIGGQPGSIRFPYYHHVFDDECRGFSRQLDFFRRHGEFLSIDEAVKLLASGDPIDGNYFCITFDDGFKNNATNAVPILVEKEVPAAFFIVTGLIGTDYQKDRDRLLKFYDHGQILMEFLDWADCRQMVSAGMTIGSHTVNHARLSELDTAGASEEMAKSKSAIEENLGQSCEHFCIPFGLPDRDFNFHRDPRLASKSGYRSLLTAQRGANRMGSTPFFIKRDHTLANWGNYQLRYFFSLDHSNGGR